MLSTRQGKKFTVGAGEGGWGERMEGRREESKNDVGKTKRRAPLWWGA